MNPESASRIARKVIAISRWLFAPVAIVFLALAIWHSQGIFLAVVKQAEIWPLLLAVLLWSGLHLLTPVFSWILLRDVDSAVTYQVLLRIHADRLPARYLPGGIWHTVSRVMDLHALGVGRQSLSRMVIAENILPVAVALILGGLFLNLAGNAHWLAAVAIVTGMASFAGGFVFLRKLGTPTIPPLLAVRYMKLTGVTAAFWIIAATAFYSYWSAFPAAREAVSGLQVYGIYLLSWAAGFVSVFAPQGIGVFESVAGVFLHGALTFSGAVVLVAGFRVAVLVADLFVYGLFLILRWHYATACRTR